MTGYRNAFITLAPGCPETRGVAPRQAGSIAGLEHALLTERPYHYSNDDLILQVHRRHKAVADEDLDVLKSRLLARRQPCMRLSMLPKRWGWGVHYDEQGRMALHAVDTDDYHRLAGRPDLRVMPARQARKVR